MFFNQQCLVDFLQAEGQGLQDGARIYYAKSSNSKKKDIATNHSCAI